MYTQAEFDMVGNIFTVATDEELEQSYFDLKDKPRFRGKEALEEIIIDEMKDRVHQRQKVMEPEYYAGA